MKLQRCDPDGITTARRGRTSGVVSTATLIAAGFDAGGGHRLPKAVKR